MLRSRASDIVLAVMLVIILITPVLAFAQIPTIVPCGSTGQEPCNLCHIGTVAQNLLNGAIFVAIFLSSITIAYAGWKYMTAGGEGGKSEGKQMLTNVIIGLVILLAAWLIVDTIMKVMFSDSVNFGPWNEIC